MNEREALICLNMVCDIGSIRLKKLLDFFGKPQNILGASEESLQRVSGIGPSIAYNIKHLEKDKLDKELTLAKKHNVEIVCLADEGYPENLKNITDPPIVLYLRGEILPLDKLGVAVVGSRNASLYGLSCAREFSRQLSEYGFTIVSGLARGIDTYAHRSALEAGGRTIAVIGSGFGHIYPQENNDLAEKISCSGAVISEFSFDTKPLKQNFPRRNRVISGLSLGVLVVEASRNSGALITADFALEQGREVFALPGKIDSGTSFGTNALIKEGAKLVTCPEEVAEEFLLNKNEPLKNKKDLEKDFPALEEEEEALYRLISNDPVCIDEIARKANIHISKLSQIILQLQVKHLIKQLAGKQYIRC